MKAKLPSGRVQAAPAWFIGGAVLFLLLCGSFTRARAQVISNPNQIYGTIAWNNPPAGPVGTFLNTAMNGLTSGAIYANTLNNAYAAVAYAAGNGPNYLSLPYLITVQAGNPNGNPPVPPIQYNVEPVMKSALGDSYHFAPATSAGVVRPPDSPDVLLNFSECAGLIKVQFCDSNGNPVTVQGGSLYANNAQGDLSPGTSEKYLAVRGGETHQLNITVISTTGTDEFVDLITIQRSFTATVTVGCDQIVTNKIIIPPPPTGTGSNALGKIIGRVDFLGQNEHWIDRVRTSVRASDGPYGNSRRAAIKPPAICAPVSPFVGQPDPCNSAGPFCLTNLVPSNFSSPAQDYIVRAAFYFGLNRRYETFVSPALDGVNGRVAVAPGQIVDLANTFVIAPGYVMGDIFLCGPAEGGRTNSCLRRLYRASDNDGDGDGIPNDPDLTASSKVYAEPLYTLAAGATKTASGGLAEALFEGDFVITNVFNNLTIVEFNGSLWVPESTDAQPS